MKKLIIINYDENVVAAKQNIRLVVTITNDNIMKLPSGNIIQYGENVKSIINNTEMSIKLRFLYETEHYVILKLDENRIFLRDINSVSYNMEDIENIIKSCEIQSDSILSYIIDNYQSFKFDMIEQNYANFNYKLTHQFKDETDDIYINLQNLINEKNQEAIDLYPVTVNEMDTETLIDILRSKYNNNIIKLIINILKRVLKK